MLANVASPPGNKGNIYVDKKSGSNTNRPAGFTKGPSKSAQETSSSLTPSTGWEVPPATPLNLIHDLQERDVGVRALVDPIKVDSSDPHDPVVQLAVVILSLFGQMERIYAFDCAAHARSVAEAKGKRVGRPSVVNPNKLRYAEHLCNAEWTMCEIVEKTSIARTTLYPTPLAAASGDTHRRRCHGRADFHLDVIPDEHDF